VSCNDVDSGSTVSSVCYESGVEVTDDFGLLVAKNRILCVLSLIIEQVHTFR
jgi:hypothetical protein